MGRSPAPAIHDETYVRRLCRAASYSKMLAATPAFNDSTCVSCGITTASSINPRISRGNPQQPSLPMNSAIVRRLTRVSCQGRAFMGRCRHQPQTSFAHGTNP